MIMSRCKKIVLMGVVLVFATAFAAYYFLPWDDMEDKKMEELMRL